MTQLQNYKEDTAEKREEPYGSGKSLMHQLELMQKGKGSKSRNEPKRKTFHTIDDLVVIAQELFAGLKKLSETKYPLDIRRGIRKGVKEKMSDEKKSLQVKASGRTYFFDVEETKGGKPYLRITESRKGRGDEWERNSLLVFPEDSNDFAKAVSKMTEELE